MLPLLSDEWNNLIKGVNQGLLFCKVIYYTPQASELIEINQSFDYYYCNFDRSLNLQLREVQNHWKTMIGAKLMQPFENAEKCLTNY